MKAYFETLGCRLNQSETGVIAKNLEKEGASIVRDAQEAGLIVVNTCTVTSQTDAKCRKTIRSLRRKNPHAKIAVVGCYAQTSASEIEKLDCVDLILGNEDKLNLHQFLPDLNGGKGSVNRVRRIKTRPFALQPDAQKLTTTRANLKIQDGCDFMCAFCIIPFARGRSRSREYKNLIEEATHLASVGVRELILTGVNIGLYQDGERGFMSVLDGLEQIKDLARIRISSIEPTTIGEEIFDRMDDASSKVLPHLHLPLQASTDAVLQDMRRRYDLEYFREFIQNAKSTVKDLCIGTDIIAGFPGENNGLFEAGYRELVELPLDYLHVFPYSERKGTRSSRMENQVEPGKISERIQKLKELDQRKRRVFANKHLGKRMKVLFESRNREGLWSGLTENYQRVLCENDSIRKGEIYTVQIKSVQEGRLLSSMPPEQIFAENSAPLFAS